MAFYILLYPRRIDRKRNLRGIVAFGLFTRHAVRLECPPHAARCEQPGPCRGGWSTDIPCIQSFASSQRSGPYAGFTEWDAAGWRLGSCILCRGPANHLADNTSSLPFNPPVQSAPQLHEDRKKKTRLSGARPSFCRHWLSVHFFFLFSPPSWWVGCLALGGCSLLCVGTGGWSPQITSPELHIWAAGFGRIPGFSIECRHRGAYRSSWMQLDCGT